jgi:hypothetical protein
MGLPGSGIWGPRQLPSKSGDSGVPYQFLQCLGPVSTSLAQVALPGKNEWLLPKPLRPMLAWELQGASTLLTNHPG